MPDDPIEVLEVIDANGKLLARYPIPSCGVFGSEEDCRAEALRRAIEDKIIPEDEASLCSVQVRRGAN